MLKHHEESIGRVAQFFEQQPEIDALILAGSIAHGFECPSSDIDVMLVISEDAHARRARQGQLMFNSKELCTYPEGYVDGKYITAAFLQKVAESGSEPARFAFQGAKVLFSRKDSYEDLMLRIVRYPKQDKAERLKRFFAQFEAWNWYVNEARRSGNYYLLWTAISRLILFGGRLVLAHNELLYPYHKWFLRVLERAPDKPAKLTEAIGDIYRSSSELNTKVFYECVRSFRDWETPEGGWPSQFLRDTELTWQTASVAIDDI